MTQLVKYNRPEEMKGNSRAKLPYDAKLIRDQLKENIYRAVAGLNMTLEDAAKYYTRPEAPLVEVLFWDAVTKRNWAVIQDFFGRTIGPQIQKYIHENLSPPEPDLSELSEQELKQLQVLNAKINSSNG
ncbi:MAG TPA: hypothetical protein PLO52_00350 [Flavobacterium alvei]|nr:hypothetical protein [Flavobacterium alvei]